MRKSYPRYVRRHLIALDPNTPKKRREKKQSAKIRKMYLARYGPPSPVVIRATQAAHHRTIQRLNDKINEP